MTFQPSSLKRLECCKVFQPEILHREQDQQWDHTFHVKMLTELGETGVCSWAVYSQYSSPGSPKLYTYRPSYILLFHSNQKITVLKRCSPSTVPPEFGTLQPEPETSLGLFHTILCQGTVQSPLRTRSTVPRRKDFQAAFVSGNSPRVYFPKEALPGECWGLKSSHVLLQRFVVLFMWRLYCV